VLARFGCRPIYEVFSRWRSENQSQFHHAGPRHGPLLLNQSCSESLRQHFNLEVKSMIEIDEETKDLWIWHRQGPILYVATHFPYITITINNEPSRTSELSTGISSDSRSRNACSKLMVRLDPKYFKLIHESRMIPKVTLCPLK
jgi:hypothetical protein